MEKLLMTLLDLASRQAFGSTVDLACKENTGFLSLMFSHSDGSKRHELLGVGTQSSSACSLVSCEMKGTQNVWFTNHDFL